MEVLDCGAPGAGEALARVMNAGQLAILPTDTVYGIAADARNPQAVARLLAAKGRGRAMPPPVLIGAVDQLADLVAEPSPAARSLAAALWPGALTLVYAVRDDLGWDLGDREGTIAIRLPAHTHLQRVLRITGPLAVTSANRTRQPPARSVEEAVAHLGQAVDLVLNGGPAGQRAVSSVVDTTSRPACLLREGAVGRKILRAIVPDLALGMVTA